MRSDNCRRSCSRTPSGKRVRQLPQFDRVVAQVLAEARLNSGHDFSLGLRPGKVPGRVDQPI